MPKLYVINDESPNAFATGRNQNHAAVAVTSGLLRILNKNELEGVIAHELSHIGNKDILISTIVVILVGFVAILSDFFIRAQFFRGRRNDREGRRTSPACNDACRNCFGHSHSDCRHAYSTGHFSQKGIFSRCFRRLLTRYPEGLASALEKISNHPAPLRRINKATAHLYISSPLKSRQATSWLGKLFMTHPPVEERIKALQGLEIK